MNKKKGIKILLLLVLIGVCIAAGMRVSSHYRSFGLSQDVISGKKTATAEETVRLYLLYLNRGDEDGLRSIQTESRNRYYSSADGVFPFLDVRLLELRELDADSTGDREARFYAEYNYSSFWAPFWKGDSTAEMEFDLIREDGKWKISEAGNG